MEITGSGKSSSRHTAVLKETAAQYKLLRSIRLRLNGELVRRLSRNMLDEGARKIGILRGRKFVFDNEDQTSVLMDYCIYDVYRNGRNAIEQYLCDCPPDPDSDEMAWLKAMQHATYTLLAVLRVEPSVGCHVQNLLTEEARLLADTGLSRTAEPGAVIATRLLDFGDFVTTGGAALPLGVLHQHELDQWQRMLRERTDEERYDPAALIRACLERGASLMVRYEGTNAQRDSHVQRSAAPVRNSGKRKRGISKREANKPVMNRRCRCGSGRMFKNCCGKQ